MAKEDKNQLSWEKEYDSIDNNPDWGLIYVGEGDENLLNMWCKGFALNYSCKALGAYNIDEYKEAVTCMY